jgi:hypothetical protein
VAEALKERQRVTEALVVDLQLVSQGGSGHWLAGAAKSFDNPCCESELSRRFCAGFTADRQVSGGGAVELENDRVERRGVPMLSGQLNAVTTEPQKEVGVPPSSKIP